MIISSNIFEAYLQCHTKCWQLSRGEAPENNVYEEWIQARNQAYRANGLLFLSRGLQPAEFLADPPVNPNFKTVLWRLASDVKVISGDLESCLHAVERTPPEGRTDIPNLVPIRFVANNKLTKLEKLLVAFDAHILSESLNLEITHGRIIHGEGFSPLKVKISVLAGEVRKLVGKIRSLLTGCVSPHLILNHHCQECGYQSLCHAKAIKNDDLSLLGGMTEKERKKFNTKGIFTVTQLSYTFRPRRRPKMQCDKREKYHHSLKALSIREKKIHIVGNFALKIEGTPVYLDVEGLPDREFYYLIGARIKHGDSVIQHSLWADTLEDEEKIWKEFVELLGTIQNAVLIHYGSYETTFMKTMCNRYGAPATGSNAEKTLSSAVNLLSVIFGRVYFPVASNSLKEIAKHYGLNWSSANASGIHAIIWRDEWDITKASNLKNRIVQYNSEDCMALNHVTDLLLNLNNSHENTVVNSEDLKPVEFYCKFRKNQFKVPELEEINIAAYWNYQRDKVQFEAYSIKKTDKQAHNAKIRSKQKVNITIIIAKPEKCPRCSKKLLRKQHQSYNRTIYDIKFIKGGVKKWVTKYIVNVHRCSKCGKLITSNIPAVDQHQYGYNIRLLTIYFNIDYQLTLNKLSSLYAQLFNYNITRATLTTFKANFASIYKDTYDAILNKIINGKVLHVDETKVNTNKGIGYVWVLATYENVVYFFSPTREGEKIAEMLANFKGVLVSDFYSVYDSIECPQQKCVIHLIRDMNDAMLHEPFNEELKALISEFALLFKSIICTVRKFGLKTYHLKKHKKEVSTFFNSLLKNNYKTEAALKFKNRLEKTGSKLFTFLDYDGVPWNNNNAEHAIKPFALMRKDLSGLTTERGLNDYLILLSLSETCKYRGLGFLDFLKSREKDIEAFAASKQKRCRKTNNRLASEVSENDGLAELWGLA